MVNKLIVLGIDGMDFDAVMKYKADLPNLVSMMEKDGFPHLRSVFPADTTPAWSTIYTGLDPSEHGIINFVNIGDKTNAYKPLEFDDSAFKGKCFWDELNRRGQSCAVILPMNIKVGWEINGLMITRPFEGKIRVYPESKRSVYNPREEILSTEGKFTSEQRLGELRDEFYEKAGEEFRLALLAAEKENVDFLFAYHSVTDGIQHDFWRHCDENHPEYPGDNKYKNVIHDEYVMADEFIGKMQALCPDAKILVISDHGHGARPVYIARINEILKREGYLCPKKSSAPKKKNAKAVLKSTAVGFVQKFGLPKFAVRLAKKIPLWKNLFASGNDFDWESTRAYLSDLSSVKNYSYGGIRLAPGAEDKDALCDEIIEKLGAYTLDDGKPLFFWIKRINTLYHGEYLNRYPEIIFQLDERYGAEWSLGEELFEKKGFMHKLSPGAHRYETAVIAAKGFSLEKPQYEMTDICPLILELGTS